MSIGIALPPATLDASDNAVDAAVAIGREIADFGVGSLWFGQQLSHDAIAVAAVVGREVPGLEVGSSAVPISARHPLLIAGAAQTAQAATHGQFTLGLALGTRPQTESTFGIDFARPAARLREFLTALNPILDSGTVDFHGETLTAVTSGSAAVAGAAPRLPVLVAAMGPHTLRAAGEFADGTIPYLAGPKALAEHIVAPIAAAAEQAGRPAPRIVAAIPGVVTADLDAARRAAEEQTHFYNAVPSYARIIELSGVSRAADLVVIGDEETVAARIAEYFEAGATDVVFSNTDLTTRGDQRRTWRLLGELNSRG
jgi:F420-dependent oxidoreductase-like protein